MNAAQRRKQRRARGLRGPWVCVWCRALNQTLGTCVGCGTRLRKPVNDCTLRELARGAHARGLKIEFTITRERTELDILPRVLDTIVKATELAKR